MLGAWGYVLLQAYYYLALCAYEEVCICCCWGPCVLRRRAVLKILGFICSACRSPLSKEGGHFLPVGAASPSVRRVLHPTAVAEPLTVDVAAVGLREVVESREEGTAASFDVRPSDEADRRCV